MRATGTPFWIVRITVLTASSMVGKSQTAAKIASGRGVGTSMWDRKEKAGKPQGFLARMRKMAEDAQKMREQQAKMRGKKKK